MSTVAIVVCALIVGLLATQIAHNSASSIPSISSASMESKRNAIELKPVDGGTAPVQLLSSQESPALLALPAAADAAEADNQLFAIQSAKLSGHQTNSDKLKRGLTNFMNQLNPSAFFVPPNSGDLTVLVGSAKLPLDHTANVEQPETLAKGPNRRAMHMHMPVGGPLRWGRR